MSQLPGHLLQEPRIVRSLLPAAVPVVTARVEDNQIAEIGDGCGNSFLPVLGLAHLNASGQENAHLKLRLSGSLDFSHSLRTPRHR
jgi:hypothetical protein